MKSCPWRTTKRMQQGKGDEGTVLVYQANNNHLNAAEVKLTEQTLG